MQATYQQSNREPRRAWYARQAGLHGLEAARLMTDHVVYRGQAEVADWAWDEACQAAHFGILALALAEGVLRDWYGLPRARPGPRASRLTGAKDG